MKLDKTRDFGEVFGSTDGTRFIQDGANFDVHGNLIGEKPKKTPAKKAATVVEDQVSAQLQDVDAQIAGDSVAE